MLVSASVRRKGEKYFVASVMSRMFIVRTEKGGIAAVCPVTVATTNTKCS